jgi:hypothetical protein
MSQKTSFIVRLGIFVAVSTGVLLIGLQKPALADFLAAYVQGYGGVSSPQGDSSVGGPSSGVSPVLGVQAGARLFGLELYGDYNSYGTGASVERGILGLRLGFDFGNTRLELRGGGGVIGEHNGALTGTLGAPNRVGVVGRAGVDLERRLAKALFIGAAIDGESFALDNSAVTPGGLPHTTWITGSDIFFSLHLKFEIGI